MTTVTLRSLKADDADAVFELLSDDRVIAHMLFPRFTRERAAAFVARFPSPEPAGTPPQVVFAIVDRQDEAIAGLCGVVLDGAQGELWYLLRPALWGRGIGTMSAAALVTHAFRQLGRVARQRHLRAPRPRAHGSRTTGFTGQVP